MGSTRAADVALVLVLVLGLLDSMVVTMADGVDIHSMGINNLVFGMHNLWYRFDRIYGKGWVVALHLHCVASCGVGRDGHELNDHKAWVPGIAFGFL